MSVASEGSLINHIKNKGSLPPWGVGCTHAGQACWKGYLYQSSLARTRITGETIGLVPFPLGGSKCSAASCLPTVPQDFLRHSASTF